MISGRPVQIVHDNVHFSLTDRGVISETPGNDLERAAEQEFLSGFVRPFDLSRAPLLRVELLANR